MESVGEKTLESGAEYDVERLVIGIARSGNAAFPLHPQKYRSSARHRNEFRRRRCASHKGYRAKSSQGSRTSPAIHPVSGNSRRHLFRARFAAFQHSFAHCTPFSGQIRRPAVDYLRYPPQHRIVLRYAFRYRSFIFTEKPFGTETRKTK